MEGIPPALDTDFEDVAWALRTASTLWARHELEDALTWLRRAAQAAGEAEDDDRALSLARRAAEVAEALHEIVTLNRPPQAAVLLGALRPAPPRPRAPPLPPRGSVLSRQQAAIEEPAATVRPLDYSPELFDDVPTKTYGVVEADAPGATVPAPQGGEPFGATHHGTLDREQALAGVTTGAMGTRFDAAMRSQVTDVLSVMRVAEGAVIVAQGEPTTGLCVVGAGEVELLRDEVVAGGLSAGQFLFASEVLGAGAAPMTARGGRGGALLLMGDRRVTQMLLVTCPPLIELLSEA